jgi:predicted AAA+ superfamily ATPase
MLKERVLTPYIVNDLREKMVFIGGPRQVGKTTLCRHFVASHFKGSAYFNWDNRIDRKNILDAIWPGDIELLIFDEIHKYKTWKNLIKGEYDKLKDKYRFLVTGSARLDLYRRSGDSLQGRYHYYRLHPFSLAEAINRSNKIAVFQELPLPEQYFQDVIDVMDTYGGFPEPFTRQDKRNLRRWHNEKLERLLREDIRELEAIRDIGNMKLLSDILPTRVGSLLSINAIRGDLAVSHRALSHWLNVLETFYYQFRIYPFSAKKIRSLKKEPKLYLWDWSEVDDESARFENLIASHLLKFSHFLVDYEGYRVDIYFLRDVDKREVDFIVTVNNKPWFAVEVRLNEEQPSPHLLYFKERLNIPYVYQVLKKNKVDRLARDVRIVSASRFLAGLF